MTSAGRSVPTDGGFAILRMYDLPEIRDAVGAFWGAVAAPLDADPDPVWAGDLGSQLLDTRLVLGQTCSWPLLIRLGVRVTVVGGFGYTRPEWETGPIYRSVLIARESRPLAEFAGGVASLNSYESTSGWLSLANAVAPYAAGHPFFGEVVLSGGHPGSMAMVREGRADVAAIDGVTYRLFERYKPDLVEGLVEVGHGPEVPTLPLVTGRDDPEPVRRAIATAVADPDLALALDQLMIESFHPLDHADFEWVRDMGQAAMTILPPPS